MVELPFLSQPAGGEAGDLGTALVGEGRVVTALVNAFIVGSGPAVPQQEDGFRLWIAHRAPLRRVVGGV
nr:hypothetical protein [Deinococcus apachensis]